MLNSLEAWPERESVIMLSYTSDHTVKVFMPTLLVSHQRLTMLKQKTASNVATLNKVALNGLVALYDSEEEERDRATNKANAQGWPSSLPYWHPFHRKKYARSTLSLS
jgi:hypothetical protein